MDRSDTSDLASRAGETTLLTIAWRWKGTIALASIAAVVLTYLALLTVTPVYQAKTQVLLGSNAAPLINIPNVVGETTANVAFAESAMIVMRSNAILRTVVEDLNLDDREEFNPALRSKSFFDRAKSWVRSRASSGGTGGEAADTDANLPSASDDPLAGTVRSLRGAVSVRVLGESQVIEIAARSANPRLAAGISDAIAETYITQQLETKLSAGGRATEFLEERALELRDDLALAEQKVAAFRSGLIGAGEDMAADLEPRLDELSGQIARLTTENSDLLGRRNEVAELFAASNYVALIETLAQPVVSGLYAQVSELEARVADLRTQFGEHPETRKATAERDRVAARLDAEVERAISGMDVRIGIIDDRLTDLNAQLQNTRRQLAERQREELTLAELEREAEASRDIYNRFLLRVKEARERSQFQTPEAAIVSNAAVPPNPIAPQKTKLSVLAGLGAGLLTLAVIALVGQHGTRVGDPDDLAALTGVRYVHQIPDFSGAEDAIGLLREMRNVPDTAMTAGVHWLRLRLAPKNRKRAHIILVTSADDGEGKSALSLLLAETFDINGYSTVLVNADPARGGLSDLPGSPEFEVSSFRYLDYSDEAMRALERKAGFDATVADRLSVLKHTDVIIVDGPAALTSPDVVEIGLLANDVVIASAWNQTTTKKLQQCIDMLRETGVTVSAIAINKVPRKLIRVVGAPVPEMRRPRALMPPAP